MRYALLLLAICVTAAAAAQTAPAAPQQTPAQFPAGRAPAPVALPGVSVSTSASTSAPALPRPPLSRESAVPLSGIVLMPTAFRGKGLNSVGLGLDFNAAYYIGRLYGKNTYDWTVEKKNYLDRIGLWLLSADSKMQVQSEDGWRPAMAAGVQGILKFRDAAQPSLNQPSVTTKINSKNTDTYANAYVVFSKRLRRSKNIILNAGYSDGDMPKVIYSMSEFLSDEAINLGNGRPATAPVRIPSGMLFGGILWLPKPDSPIGLEIMAPQGAPQAPVLYNIHLGSLLKLNFELSYLTFKNGWDLMGMFQFRYNYLPK